MHGHGTSSSYLLVAAAASAAAGGGHGRDIVDRHLVGGGAEHAVLLLTMLTLIDAYPPSLAWVSFLFLIFVSQTFNTV